MTAPTASNQRISPRRFDHWFLPINYLICTVTALTVDAARPIALAVSVALVLIMWRTSRVLNARCEALKRLADAQRERADINAQMTFALNTQLSRYRRSFIYANEIRMGRTPRDAGMTALTSARTSVDLVDANVDIVAGDTVAGGEADRG
jgi:hypothetical protein